MHSTLIYDECSVQTVPLMEQSANQRFTQDGLLILVSYFFLISLSGGRNQTVSRRSELNSRTPLEHEQCYPSQLLHQEDAISQHRGRKPRLQ